MGKDNYILDAAAVAASGRGAGDMVAGGLAAQKYKELKKKN